MILRKGFALQPFGNQWVAVSVAPTGLPQNVLVNLNRVSAFLWEQLQEEKTFQQLLDAVLETFEVEEARAKEDLEDFLQILRQNDLIIE
jgi:hypothetical protein